MERKLALVSPLILLVLIVGLIIWGLSSPRRTIDGAIEDEITVMHRGAWIHGLWYRVDSTRNTTFYEEWAPKTKLSIHPNRTTLLWSDSILGTGFSTTTDNDTSIWEHLVIDTKPSKWTYTARVKGQQAITFIESMRSDSMLQFENLKHDFPKYIRYNRKGSTLHARVWNETETLSFTFTLKHE